MANIATFKIQFKSDFVLTIHGDAGWTTPFCIKFWTGAPSQAYFVGWDGNEYINCKVDDTDASKLIVLFDDHQLPVGQLKMQMAWHTTIADFPKARFDEVMNQVDVVATVEGEDKHVELAFEGEADPEVEYFLPAYANEAQRIANEEQRIAHEAIRIVNEESRIAAETIRQQNEEQRIQHEEYRVSEFARLKSESEAATTASNAAASLANEKAALADNKAALAQAAATLANEKAQLAADKAALAAAAATLANDKAALAQQKAEYAQTQGDYAKAQGNYAKEQGEIAEEDHERAESDHTRAESDHTTAANDHNQASSDHTRAEVDHSTASADHTTANNDHTQAGTDHTRAESDHATASADHTQAGTDHTRAEGDHSTASADHTQAGTDHTRAESDHTRAESDHAAVEVYVDSLGAFDISAYHATGGVLAKYADLTAALGTNGANIPDALRKGGMSVKFVLSSDNNYIQARCIANEFTTDVTKWQGVDDVPTVESDNLVKSGGVYDELVLLDGFLDFLKEEGLIIKDNTFVQYSDGQEAASNGYKCTDYIEISSFEERHLQVSKLIAVTPVAIIACYDANKVYLKNESTAGTGGEYSGNIVLNQDVAYIKICGLLNNNSSVKHPVYKKIKEDVFDLKQFRDNSIAYDIVFVDVIVDNPYTTLKDNTFVQYSNGQELASNGYKCTDYIKVTKGTVIDCSLFGATVSVAALAFYDADKNYLKNISVTYPSSSVISGTIAIPNDAVYVKISWNTGRSNLFAKMWVQIGQKTITNAFIDIDQTFHEISNEITNIEGIVGSTIMYSAFGDSISSDTFDEQAGSGSDGLAYPRILAKLLNASLDRYTVPGTGINYMKGTCVRSSVDAKLVTVMYGINDVERMEIGDLSTIMAADLATLENDTTFMGMYRWCLETLKNRLTDPNALICCISPCTNYTYDNPDGSRRSQWLVDLRATIKEFVRLEGGPNAGWYYIDGTDILPWDALYFIGTTNVPDSTHPNSMGEAIMAHGILNRLPNINLFVSRK